MKRTITTFTALLVLSALTSAQSTDTPAVFEPYDGQPVLRSAATPEMVSPRLVTPHLDVLDAAQVDQQLLFEFAVGLSYVGVVRSVTRRPGRCYTVTGSLGTDADAYFIISREEEALAGIFHVPSGAFLAGMRFAGEGAHWLYEVDESHRPGCGGSPRPPIRGTDVPDEDFEASVRAGGQEMGRYTSCPPSQYVHDYMVVYTDLVRVAAGGTNAIQAIIQTHVAWTSLAYANSSINLRMRLVHCDEVVYDEVVPPGTDDPRPIHLDRVTNPTDGFIDVIHTWRNTYNADAVMLMLETSFGGMGWCCADEDYAFAVMHRTNSAFIFAHEFGHNQGCAHNSENVDCEGCFSYSRAHWFEGDDEVTYGTIMSYIGSPIPHFSNPNITYAGQPTGMADQRDNARTIRERRGAIEDFELTRFDIWVDFSATGFEFGTPVYPYASLASAVNAVPAAECFSEMPKIWIETGTTLETPTIDKPMILNACGGTVRIGG